MSWNVSSLPAWECGLKYSFIYCIESWVLSLPAWECGLKSVVQAQAHHKIDVTPCVGVWIEMSLSDLRLNSSMSLPAWECGLKLETILQSPLHTPVTPCVGVWIEIFPWEIYWQAMQVTPCVGVWIEISSFRFRNTFHSRHSLRGSVD